ncbi:MAG: GNAT family N-acetyltransferase [Anaerolineaceae bacterium]|nr:GNAT family N-acetyltransferase [Anaerolineaceae bacterium]
MSMLQARIHREPSIFQSLQKEWNPLVFRSSANRIFSTWEWNWHWWRAYSPGELAIITVRDPGGQLLGIAPWFIEEEEGHRLVATIGCDEVSDYLDLIIAHGAEEPVLAAITSCIIDEGIDADCFYFCNMPADSPARHLWPAILDSAGFSTQIEPQEICPRIQLPGRWEDYLQQISKKQRHELRRKLRRFAAIPEETAWFSVTRAEQLSQALPQFFQLMSKSDPAKAAFITEPANQDFFEAISHSAAENNWLQLSFLTIRGECCAAYFNFCYENELLVYNSGLSAGRYAVHSPGIVLLAYMIQDAIEKGMSLIDFLRGDETYKFRMGGIGAPIYKLIAQLPVRETCSPSLS